MDNTQEIIEFIKKLKLESFTLNKIALKTFDSKYKEIILSFMEDINVGHFIKSIEIESDTPYNYKILLIVDSRYNLYSAELLFDKKMNQIIDEIILSMSMSDIKIKHYLKYEND